MLLTCATYNRFEKPSTVVATRCADADSRLPFEIQVEEGVKTAKGEGTAFETTKNEKGWGN